MSQTTRSAISTLPNELLLHIFRHVSVITPRFPWNKSPLLLSHVCILWRNLILATSSLWSDIDLHHLSMAKHRLALARDQPLDIIWFRSDDNSTSLEQYEWVSSFAARIVTLRLVLPSAGAVDLFNRVGKELSQLRELIASAGFRHMNPLQLAHMPNLRVLSISNYMLDGANLMEVLRNSVMLMKLKLARINIPQETLDSVGSIGLPRLRSFELESDDTATLDSLITSVALPTGPGLHLEIMEYVSYTRSPLHASIIIETIRITTIRLDERFITFAESTNKKRCTISLRVELRMDGYLELIPPYPDLTSVTTVDVLHPESIMPRLPTNPSVLDLLTRILSSVSELIVHSAALWTSAEGDSSQWLQKFLPASQLKVLTLQDVNLDADTDSGLKNIQIISEFATEMLSKEQVALSKLVLRNCETDRQGISILRAILPVEVIY